MFTTKEQENKHLLLFIYEETLYTCLKGIFNISAGPRNRDVDGRQLHGSLLPTYDRGSPSSYVRRNEDMHRIQSET